LGYFILCFGGDAAKPYAIMDGQKYAITVEGKGDAKKQFVMDQGQKLQIKGNEDKSISLLAADGSEARRIQGDNFEAGG
jgi:proton-dependent oligopeptide transporter, POT family